MHSLHFDKTAIIQFSCTEFKTRKVLFANISNFRLTATNPWRKCSKTRFARTSTYILSKAAWLTSADSIQNKKHLLVEIGIRRGKGLPTDGWILGWRHFHIYFTPRIEVKRVNRFPRGKAAKNCGRMNLIGRCLTVTLKWSCKELFDFEHKTANAWVFNAKRMWIYFPIFFLWL